MTPDSEASELELRDYLEVLRRRKWIVVGVAAIVVAASLVISLVQTKKYKATAEVLLQPRASEQIFTPTNGQQSQSDQVAVQTEIEVMRSRSVELAVTKELGHAPHVSISAKGQTRVVTVSATNTSPEQAAREANTFVDGYIKTRRQQAVDDLLAASAQVQSKIADIDKQLAALDTGKTSSDTTATRTALENQRVTYSGQLSQLQLAGNLTQTGGAQQVSAAAVPTSPVSPRPKRNAVLALVVGLLLGIGVAFLRDYLDETIRTKEDVEAATGHATVLGLIPIVAGWKEGNEPYVVAAADPRSAAAEAYRSLRTSIQFLGLDYPLDILQVTSATAAEGKTTTLSNLAVSLAQAGKNVLMVCCDLRRPRLHEFFGLDNKVGFTSVLVGEATLDAAIQPVVGQPRLSMLASGATPPNPAELLSSPRVPALFSLFREKYDVVLLDSPPVLPVTDASILARLADATVIVATASTTSKRDLKRTMELLDQVQANVVGTIVNGIGAGDGGAYYYRYGYSYADKQRARR